MKTLAMENIVLGNKYILVNKIGGYRVGDVVIAVGEDDGAICNDESSHAFRLESHSFGHNYIHYEDIEEYDDGSGKVGHVFEVVDKGLFAKDVQVGDIAVLIDAAEGHLKMMSGKAKGCNQYDSRLEWVKRVYPPVPEPVPVPSATVTIMCEGKETTLSRESAKELNLI